MYCTMEIAGVLMLALSLQQQGTQVLTVPIKLGLSQLSLHGKETRSSHRSRSQSSNKTQLKG